MNYVYIDDEDGYNDVVTCSESIMNNYNGSLFVIDWRFSGPERNRRGLKIAIIYT
jgi:hypothetical protein